MSDLPPREQIRAEVIEVLAAAQRAIDIGQYPHMSDGTPRPAWEGCTDRRRDMYREAAVPFVDALAAAGLLPTAVEVCTAFPDEPEADDEMTCRYVTDWREADR